MQDRTAAEPLTRVLTRAARAVTGRVELLLRAEGFSLDQWVVLEALAGQPGRQGLTMADLAAETMITGPTLTRVVDRLVTEANVYREVDQRDRRKIRVYLSPRGRSAHRRLATEVEALERTLLDRTGDATATLALLGGLAAAGLAAADTDD